MTASRAPMSDLKPARFEGLEEEGKAFAPKLPWKFALAVIVLVVGSVGYYQWNERSRAHHLRATVAARYEMHIVPVRERISQFRDLIEGWVQEAALQPPETWADPRLNLAGLHRAQGIYMRIHVSQAVERETIGLAAQTMRPDAITRCLGLSPLTMKGFYDRATVLERTWLQDATDAEDDVLTLRVLDENLKNRIELDLPLMLDASQSDYFLLVIQHGDSRRSHPVDVFLWDMRRREPLLRVRTQARGALIPVRVALGDTPYGKAPPPAQRSGVTDCSIAAQIRAAAGAELVGVHSEMPIGEIIEPPVEDTEEDEPERTDEPVEP